MLAQRLPSRNSRDHGRSFAEIFKAAGYDFYKIDPALFAPAEVWVSNLDSGNTWHGGALEHGACCKRLWLQASLTMTVAARVAIMTDAIGWHTRQLQAALRERGASDAASTSPIAASTPRPRGTAW